MSGTGRCYVGRAMALHVAGVGHLPELGARHHPHEMEAVVKTWLASDRDVVCFNPYALDAIPADQAHRILCVASRLKPDGTRESVSRRLVDEPRWSFYKHDLKPGEFWATVGEDWAFDLPREP